ncbi:MAG: hypothetical protein KJ922_01825 [Nanoarchaeota archaeon]|nr:hypothetical protein [Nanoarchaeota archaeon]
MAKLEDLVESTHISEAELARNSFIERNILNIAKNAFNNENIASIGSSASGTYIPCREYGGISEDIDLEIVGNYDLMDTLPVIIGMREQIVDVCETALGLEGLHLELRKAEHHPEAGYKQVFVEVMDGDNKVIKIDFNYADKEDGTSWYRPVFEGQLNYLLRNINPDERVEARDYIVSQIRAFKQALKDHNVYSTRDGGLKGVGAEQLIVTLDT